MIAIRTHVKPRNGRVSIDIPPGFPQTLCELILLPVEPEGTPEEAPRPDFSDLAGRLKWKGDAVAEQRALRNEW